MTTGHGFQFLTVRDVQPEAEDAVRVTLDVPPELQARFRAQPGQHVVVRLQLEGVERRRTYSLIGAAGELPLTLGVRIHAHGHCSQHLGRVVRRGDRLELMPPTGGFGAALVEGTHSPDGHGATYVAFAAGSGITPVLSIVRTALQEQPRARVILFYGNRSAARAMFFEELQALKNRFMARFALHFLMSAEPQEATLLNGRLDAAKVRELAARLFEPGQVDAFFVCGPGTMIEDVGAALGELGVARKRIHAEHFNVDAQRERAHPAEQLAHATSKAGLTEVSVLIDGRRRTFTMRMADETILDAAARAGLDLPYSCRAGVCATCRTKLLRGKVSMAENYSLEEWELEQGYILACQSRAETPEIELDYDAR